MAWSMLMEPLRACAPRSAGTRFDHKGSQKIVEGREKMKQKKQGG
jgi:hypothetical protein